MAGQQHGDRFVRHVRTDVGAQTGDVAAAVVDAEPEPAGQCCQRGLGPDRGVQPVHPVADIGGDRRRGPTAARRRYCEPARGWPTATNPPLRRRRPRRSGLLFADAADLDVAPRRQLHRRRAEPGRRVGQRLELGRVDHPARQTDPSQRAVGGPMHLQRARTGVLVAGAGHPLTVRVALGAAIGVVHYSCVNGRPILVFQLREARRIRAPDIGTVGASEMTTLDSKRPQEPDGCRKRIRPVRRACRPKRPL